MDRHLWRGRWSGRSVATVGNVSLVTSDVGGKKSRRGEMEGDGSGGGRGGELMICCVDCT